MTNMYIVHIILIYCAYIIFNYIYIYTCVAISQAVAARLIKALILRSACKSPASTQHQRIDGIHQRIDGILLVHYPGEPV